MSSQTLQIVEAFRPLLDLKCRYKTFHGGRGGAKTHNFGACALIKCSEGKMKRFLCAREIQGSIKDSVHHLLEKLIWEHDQFKHFYTVYNNSIVGDNGSEFLFKGLKHNIDDIKSTDDVDFCWIEEAQNVSDSSWEVLIPTIRNEHINDDGELIMSEIWTSFNNNQPTDPTYKRLVIDAEGDEDMFVCKVNYYDNPFFPKVLELERARCEKNDPEAYKHIWLGEFDERKEGFIFANTLKEARADNRITTVPHKAGVPVLTVWDLGKRHETCIWFVQQVGCQVRIVDYYSCTGDDADVDEIAKVLRAKKYEYGMHYLPHDGAHERIGMKGSVSDQLNEIGIKNEVLALAGVAAGIKSAKSLIKEAYIDSTLCKDGIHGMNNYRYQYDDVKKKFKDKPFDDWACDPSDAFRGIPAALAEYGKNEYNIDLSNIGGTRIG